MGSEMCIRDSGTTTLSDLEWPFHASRVTFAVAELLVTPFCILQVRDSSVYRHYTSARCNSIGVTATVTSDVVCRLVVMAALGLNLLGYLAGRYGPYGRRSYLPSCVCS